MSKPQTPHTDIQAVRALLLYHDTLITELNDQIKTLRATVDALSLEVGQYGRVVSTGVRQFVSVRERVAALEGRAGSASLPAAPPAPPKARRPGKIIDFASARRA
ncbi:hypothetical protein [uncultured Desulfovibrio sp.]|uniref:hypothetical protein n=1 Tax=uncultured Desulfovibrio sp. TaxID=167968 RepID=UPI002711F06D|nr:hypothetical protein [uncultured Desulfovibrio sp.]